MKPVTMTAKGNIRVTDEHGNTSKFYAKPASLDSCQGCCLNTDGKCANSTAACVPHERNTGLNPTFKYPGQHVVFVTKGLR